MSNESIITVGDKATFALQVTFESDPDKGESATEEECSSWGSIQIWVRDKNLCAHLEDGRVQDSVRWYLLPLIEWFASNWNPLFHEERLPNRNAADSAWQSLVSTKFPPISYDENAEDQWLTQWQEWWFRHSLRSCRFGGLFPDIVIRRWMDMVELSWGDERLIGIPEDVIFLHPVGVERLTPGLVANPLYDMLSRATDYLLKPLPSSGRLREIAQRVKAIQNTPKDNRLAWLAGLGPSYQIIKENWDKVISIIYEKNSEVAGYLLDVPDNKLVIEGSCHAVLMFGSAAPTLSEDDRQILASKLIELYSPDSEGPELRDLVANESIDFNEQPAWEIGYALAKQVIEHFSLEQQPADSVDISAILVQLGIRQEKIQVSDKQIRGVSIAGPRHQPSILINSNDSRNETPPGERFTLAHELCHILFDRTFGRKLAMVSDMWAPRQVEQRANAFAAMLLMPQQLIQRAIGALTVPLASEQAIHEIRKRLRTSFSGTLDHLTNLGWLDSMTANQIAEARDERLSRQEE